jgi:uncharacterized protein (TIGR01777 family)
MNAHPPPAGSRRVLITGGSGLIGRAAAAELSAAGYEVVVLSRCPERVEGLPAGVRAAGWDGATADGWGELADGAAGIVHLAGAGIAERRWTDERKRVLRDSRVESSRAVVEAIERARDKPRFLLQASGVDYYRADGQPADETAPVGEGFLSELAMEWEAASRAVEQMGVRRAILRTSMVLSTEGGALPKIALPFKLFVGGPVGSGEQWVSWIHHRDQARAIRLLAERDDARGPFNLGTPNPVTNRELSKTIARVLGRPCLFRVPAVAMHALLGEMSELLLTGRRVVPAALERLGFEFEHPRLEPALRDLLG